MTEPYQLSDLGQKLKDKGLDVAEKTAADVYEALKEWYTESAKLSKNPFDDMVIPFITSIDSVVLPQIDKINGKVG